MRESPARRDDPAGAREVTIPSWAGVRAGPRHVIPDRMQRPIKCDVCPVTSYTSAMGMVKAAETASREQQVGDHLRDVRTRQGFSVRALAARAGCSPSFISQVEHGQASPSISSLERLVQALGMTLGDFFRANTPPAVVRSHERAALTQLVVRRADRGARSGWSGARAGAAADHPGAGRAKRQPAVCSWRRRVRLRLRGRRAADPG